MEMCLGARAGSHEMAEMTGQTRRVDEELGGTGMNAVREPWEAAGVTRLLPEPRGGPVMPLVSLSILGGSPSLVTGVTSTAACEAALHYAQFIAEDSKALSVPPLARSLS